MAFQARFIPATDFALAEVSGRFSTEELLGLFDLLLSQRSPLRGARIFCDVSAADSTDVSTGVMAPAVEYLRARQQLFAGMKWANYASASLLNFAISRMAGELSGDLPFEYRAFRNREQALNWLAMPLALRLAHLPECSAIGG